MPRQEEIFYAGNHRGLFVLQDCLQGMKKLEGNAIDVIVTSPPYNIGVSYNSHDDSIPRKEYLAWIREWCEEAKRVLRASGSIFFNLGGKPSDPWGPFEVALQFRSAGYCLQNVIHWIKAITIDKKTIGKAHGFFEDLSVGHYKPINSNRFVNDTHEYIFHFTRTGDVKLDRLSLGAPYQDKSNIKRWRNGKEGIRCRGNSWFIPYSTIKHRDRDRPHPASFPPRLPEMCIKLHGIDKTKLVLDPFMGIGNSALACIDSSIDFIGFEIDEVYFETAVRLARERINLFSN